MNRLFVEAAVGLGAHQHRENVISIRGNGHDLAVELESALVVIAQPAKSRHPLEVRHCEIDIVIIDADVGKTE